MKTPAARVRLLQEQRLDLRDTAAFFNKALKEVVNNTDWSDYLKLEAARMAIEVVNFKENFIEDALTHIIEFKEGLSEGQSND